MQLWEIHDFNFALLGRCCYSCQLTLFKVTNPEPESDFFLAFSERSIDGNLDYRTYGSRVSWSALMIGRKGNKYFHLFL